MTHCQRRLRPARLWPMACSPAAVAGAQADEDAGAKQARLRSEAGEVSWVSRWLAGQAQLSAQPSAVWHRDGRHWPGTCWPHMWGGSRAGTHAAWPRARAAPCARAHSPGAPAPAHSSFCCFVVVQLMRTKYIAAEAGLKRAAAPAKKAAAAGGVGWGGSSGQVLGRWGGHGVADRPACMSQALQGVAAPGSVHATRHWACAESLAARSRGARGRAGTHPPDRATPVGSEPRVHFLLTSASLVLVRRRGGERGPARGAPAPDRGAVCGGARAARARQGPLAAAAGGAAGCVPCVRVSACPVCGCGWRPLCFVFSGVCVVAVALLRRASLMGGARLRANSSAPFANHLLPLLVLFFLPQSSPTA